MLPTYVVDHFYQRDGYSDDVTFADADGTPIDMSGSTFTANIKGENGGIQTGALAFTIDTTSAASGSIMISLAAADCLAVTGPGRDREWPLIFDLYEAGTFDKTICEGLLIMRTAA